MKTKKQQTAS